MVNTLHKSLAEVEAGKQDDTLRDVQAAGLANTLADTLAEVKATNLKAVFQVATLASTLAEIEAETAGKVVRVVKAQALVDTLCATLLEVVARTILDTLTYVEPNAPVETQADTLSVV